MGRKKLKLTFLIIIFVGDFISEFVIKLSLAARPRECRRESPSLCISLCLAVRVNLVSAMFSQKKNREPVPCDVCTREVTKDSYIVCKVCRRAVAHPPCVLDADAPAVAATALGASWVCKGCSLQQQKGTSSEAPFPSPLGAPVTQDSLAALQRDLIAAINQRADGLETRFAAVEKSLEFISDQYDTLVKEIESQKALNADLQKGIDKVSKQMYEKDLVVNQLTARVNQLEQSSLAQTIEIHGVPVSGGENLLDKVQMIATKIGAPDVAGTVDDVYLVPAAKPINNKPRPGYIVLRLKFHSAKVAWLEARKRLQQQQRKEWEANQQGGAPQDTGASSGGAGPSWADAPLPPSVLRIYEQLTPYNKRLLFLTRTAARHTNFQFVWVKDGKIFVKHDPDKLAQVIKITCEGDIKKKMGYDVTYAQI